MNLCQEWKLSNRVRTRWSETWRPRPSYSILKPRFWSLDHTTVACIQLESGTYNAYTLVWCYKLFTSTLMIYDVVRVIWCINCSCSEIDKITWPDRRFSHTEKVICEKMKFVILHHLEELFERTELNSWVQWSVLQNSLQLLLANCGMQNRLFLTSGI